MTTTSTPETGKTDNGKPTETEGAAGTEQDGTTSETEEGTDTGSEPTEEDGRLKQLRKKLDAQTKRLAELEEAEQERARAEMSETDRLKADLAARDQQLADLQSAALRSRIATEFGLDADLADRLKGDSEEALRADAGQLSEKIGTRTPPPAPPPGDAGIGGKAAPSTSDPLELHRRATSQAY